MTSIRKAGWFLVVALAMAGWTGLLGSVRGEAIAGIIASRGGDGSADRSADLEKVQALLEKKVVMQKFMDYGVSPTDAMAKVRAMNDRDLHRLASLADRAGEGADDGLGLAIGLAILVILIIVILKLTHKEVIIR